MADINGYLKDRAGEPSGTTSNPIYVAFSTTVPQNFHFSAVSKGITYDLEEHTHLRDPRSIFERFWQWIGKIFKWVI
jgi:hypothetical protein